MVRVIGSGVDSPLVEDVGGRLLEEARRSVSRGEPVLLVARGAWRQWLELRRELYRGGGNWLLVEALDPLEAVLAGLQLEQLIAARVTLAAYEARLRAPAVVEGGKRVSRRELLRSLGATALAYRDAVWVLDSSRCSSPGCPLCTRVCPSGALLRGEEGVEVEAERCTGCGLCLSSCPYGVLVKHSVSPQLLWDYLRMLPPDPRGGLVVYACRESLASLLEGLEGWEPAWRLIVAPVNCPGEATLELLLAGHLLGLAPAVYCPEAAKTCGSSHVKSYASTVLLDYERVTGSEPLVAAEPGELKSFEPSIPPLLEPWEQPPAELKAAARVAAARLLSSRGAGRVELETPFQALHVVDAEKCTLCGACVVKCPTSALSLERGEDYEEIVYEPLRCIACHSCEAVCPEKALVVKHAAYPREPRRYTVHRDEVVKCIVCGRPVGPKKLIKATEERLRKAGAPEALIRELYLCDECKKRKALGLLEEPRRRE